MKWYQVFNSKEEALSRVEEKTGLLIKIGPKRINLSRFNNTFYATDDVCPHNGDSLSNGKVNYLGEVVCPWHNYRYALKSGKECQERTHDVNTYPVEERTDGIYLGIPE